MREDGNDLAPMPDLPISTHPNYVTRRGLAALSVLMHTRHNDLTVLRALSDRLDMLPEAAAERGIRYLESRLRSTILVDPAGQPLTEMAFGPCVVAEDHAGQITRQKIVGEDAAEARLGRVAPQSPLARALIGARVGDTVTRHRSSGVMSLTV